MVINEPLAETSSGCLRGFFVEEDEFKGSVFLGVPFAQPPVGDLRFENPTSLKKWPGIRDATTFADVCFPHSRPAANGPLTYSEDCLYLNVFAPSEQSKVANGYPVMVMIHGGSYESGSARRYADYRQLMRKFVSKGIIVVTIQYRLGFLGFCSTGDSVMQGNFGLWDQLAALQWVNREIHNFGGDNKRITTWGYSAGSSSVSGLTLSPRSRDLFSQAVQMSGSVFAAWTTSDKVIDATRELAEVLQCNMCSSASMKEDLKRRSIDQFYDAVDAIGGTRYDINWVKFGPRLDGDFFPRDYPELLKEAPTKPTLLGCTEEESLLWTLVSTSNTPMFAYAVAPEKRSTFGQSDIEQFVQAAVASKDNFGNKADEVQRTIVDFYCNYGESVEKSSTFFLDRYSQLCSDIQMNVPILWETRRKVEAGWPVYLYKNEYYNEGLFSGDFPVKANYHGVDQAYVISNGPFGFSLNDDDRSVEATLVDATVAFVKTGTPSTSIIAWPRVSNNDSFEYLNIMPKPEVRDRLFVERLQFWDQLTRLYDYDIVRGMHIRALSADGPPAKL